VDKKETHYKASNGMLYTIEEYQNWGTVKERDGKKDLPLEGYPYTRVYEVSKRWEFCRRGHTKIADKKQQ
jgi:hypothetical protein